MQVRANVKRRWSPICRWLTPILTDSCRCSADSPRCLPILIDSCRYSLIVVYTNRCRTVCFATADLHRSWQTWGSIWATDRDAENRLFRTHPDITCSRHHLSGICTWTSTLCVANSLEPWIVDNQNKAQSNCFEMFWICVCQNHNELCCKLHDLSW